MSKHAVGCMFMLLSRLLLHDISFKDKTENKKEKDIHSTE